MMKSTKFLTGAVAVLLTVLLAFTVCSAQDAMPEQTYSYWDTVLADFPDPWIYNGPYTYEAGKTWTVTLDPGITDHLQIVGEYSGNSAEDAGTYTAQVTLTSDDAPEDDKTHTFSQKWEIVKADWEAQVIEWDYSDAFPYDGTDKTVTLDEASLSGLPEGYAVAYTGNTQKDAGTYTATATVTHKNYNMPAVDDLNWAIGQGTYDLSGVKLDRTELTYTGAEQSVALTGLPQGVSATLSGNTGKNAGSYTATVNAASVTYDSKNYKAPDFSGISLPWAISKGEYDMSKVAWDYSGTPFVYDGKEKQVTLTGLPAGVTAAVTGGTATDAGAYTAAAALTYDKDNYKAISVDPCKWEIAQAEYDMSKVKWDYPGTPFVYDGKEKQVSLTGLPAGVTATVTGGTATEAGTYTATAALTYDKDNYKAISVDPCSWAIARAEYDMGKVKWDYPGTPFSYDGKEKQVSLTGLPEGVKAAYTGNTATEAGTYTAAAVLSTSDANYKTPSVDPLTWEIIGKKQYDMSGAKWDYPGTPYVWDGTKKSVSLTGLPEGVTVSGITSGKATEPGTYTAEALLKWDTENYEEPSVDPLSWKIVKADYDMSGVKWDYSGTAFTYDGNEHTVELTGVPEGVLIRYYGNKESTAGSYLAKADIEGVADPEHYNIPIFREGKSEIMLNWRISSTPATETPDISKITDLSDDKAKAVGFVKDKAFEKHDSSADPSGHFYVEYVITADTNANILAAFGIPIEKAGRKFDVDVYKKDDIKSELKENTDKSTLAKIKKLAIELIDTDQSASSGTKADFSEKTIYVADSHSKEDKTVSDQKKEDGQDPTINKFTAGINSFAEHQYQINPAAY